MSSRSGSGPNSHQRSRDSRDPRDDYPPLPSAPALPSLRTLNSPRDRENSSSSAQPHRPQRQWSTASRRAERIRSLDERSTNLLDDFDRSIDQSWHSSRRIGRMRSIPDTRTPSFEDPDRSLDEANSHLRALLDLTTHSYLTSPSFQSTLSPPLRSHDFPDENRRNKRRKLESDRLSIECEVFRYGKYGQVEPGQLRMEIVSCDGGMFSDQSSYAAENILKDDNSVYCTKGNRCNIVLRHQGGTSFTLQELIIKAPCSTNYSHPVREGMVFVAMNQDDMLSRTAQYQIQYGPTTKETSRGGEARQRRAAPREPRHIISIQHHDDGTTTRTRRAVVYRPEDDDDDDGQVPQMPEEFATDLPDFRVTTECSDDEEDDAYDGHRLRRPPNRIGSLPFETPDSEPDDLPMPFGSEDLGDDLLLHHSRRNNIIHRDQERDNDRLPSLSLAEAMDAHTNATQEAVRAVGGGELLAPHARFYIEKKKSKCTIKFDPPVSGRFILLKMWSSKHDPGSNIDIQSVIARGFAGPRYFPSIELR